MYKPLPARPKKTNIVRTRTGCESCRKRRSKCDEKKPSCGRCIRQGKCCEYKTRIEFRIGLPTRETSKSWNDSRISDRSDEEEKPVYYTPSPIESHVNSSCLNLRSLGRGEDGVSDVSGQEHSWSPTRVENSIYLSERVGFGTYLSNASIFPSWESSLFPLLCRREVETTLVSPNDQSHFPSAEIDMAIDKSIAPPASPHIWRSRSMDESGVRPGTVILNHPPGSDTGIITVDNTLSSADHESPFYSQLMVSPPRSQTPDIDLLYHDIEADNNAINMTYLAHWQANVLSALPPVFREVTMMMDQFLALKQAILAVSACNIGRSRPEIKKRTENSTWYGPSRRHQHQSQNYYNTVIRQLTHLNEAQYKTDSLPILAVLLLFNYIEMGTGSFGGFSLHLQGVEILLADQFHTFQSRQVGRKLLGVWICLRAYNWWLRRPFCTPNFHQGLRLMGIRSGFESILRTYEMRRERVLVILCESHRLSSMLLIERSIPRDYDHSESLSTRCHRNILELAGCASPRKSSRPKIDVPDEDYVLLLGKQWRMLEEWHSMLNISDLPVESFSPSRFDIVEGGSVMSNVHPLKFHSHNTAMDYAYYVSSRILGSISILDELTLGRRNVADADDDINPWIMLLLRIAAGLDIMTCVQQNSYTVGITGMLLACVLRCPSAAVGKWVENWISDFKRLFIFEEGGTPLLQILDIIRTVNDERDNGRDVFAVYDGEGADDVRLDSYCCQNITSLVVYGRIRRTGKLFRDHIAIKPEIA